MTQDRRPIPAYTRADLEGWKADMLQQRPKQPRPEGLVTGLVIVSFDAGASRNGLYLHFSNNHGEEGTILLNPVAAAALRDAITECGQEGHWLEADGTPVVPER